MTDQQEVPCTLSIGTKSSTLDDLEWLIRTWLRKRCIFWIKYKNFNEDRPILSTVRWATNRSEAAKIDNFLQNTASVLRYFEF